MNHPASTQRMLASLPESGRVPVPRASGWARYVPGVARRRIKKLFFDGLESDHGPADECREVLREAVHAVKDVEGLLLEIGTRRGGSAKIIVQALLANQDLDRVLVCVDPYGDIPYAPTEGTAQRFNYTNQMRNDTLRNLYRYTHTKRVSVHLLILEDTEYFKRFPDGYPVYDHEKRLLDRYALVYFDGPHDVESVSREIEFFDPRTSVRGRWVFDDVRHYDHDTAIEPRLFTLGWQLVSKSADMASHLKTR